MIQIDTDRVGDKNFEVGRPDKKQEDYTDVLRGRVIEYIQSWLGKDFEYLDKIFYATSIESIDSWMLTMYTHQDTTKSSGSKSKLRHELGQKRFKISRGQLPRLFEA